MIIDKLYERVETQGPVCLGLDPSPELLPEGWAEAHASLAEAYLEFNKRVIDATLEVVACYKLQIAHYEALGVAGLACYRETLRYIRGRGAISIGDVKRGDIASTAAMYAQAHFQGDFEADFLTLNPLLGSDSLAPFLRYVESGGKGLFLLVRTSNPSAAEFQDLPCEGRPLYRRLAERTSSWGERFRGEHGYSLIGGVVGANAQVLKTIREEFPGMFLLVPGYGAQGGGARDVAPAFARRNGAVVVAARSILGAHRAKPDAQQRFAEHARDATLAMRKEILRGLE